MTNLERRLRKLEAVLTDSTGLVLHSQEWVDYWRLWVIRRNSDPDFHPRERMPLDAMRALIQRTSDSDWPSN
jgi:hypothetical protein